ncbi:MAG: xylulokinase [Myxococcales bacterium]|nr:xylulokinase [Myxococcales bacterium]
MSILIGIDVGTSGVKALAIDATAGSTLASATHELDLETPHPGWAEQEPEHYRAAARAALAEVATRLGPRRRKVRGIGLTGQMHTAVVLDAERRVLRKAILWCDTRTTAECARIEQALGRDGLRRHVGNLALEGFTLPKLLWLARHEPELWSRAALVLMPKDYVGLTLTGEVGTDDSDASGTLAFDSAARAWSEPVLRAVGVSRDLFPAAGPSTAVLGTLREAVARDVGLPAGIPVARGAADNAAAAAGLGVVRDGRAMASLGTSGVVLVHTDRHVVEPEMRLHSFCHAVEARYYLMGVMLAAGGALRWYRDTLCDGEKLAAELRHADPYELISEAASTSRPGAGGVVFLPYLMGERTPHNDAHARGAFVGLTARTTKADVSRAVLEGVSYGLADSLSLVRELAAAGTAPAPTEVRLTGGGARSPFWRRLLCDVLEASVCLTSSTEGPSYGAALCAGVAAGCFASLPEAADALVHVTSRLEPEPSLSARYRDTAAVYRALYHDLAARFRELGGIDAS